MYLAQDADKVFRQMKEQGYIQTKMLDERNINWIPVIEKKYRRQTHIHRRRRRTPRRQKWCCESFAKEGLYADADKVLKLAIKDAGIIISQIFEFGGDAYPKCV